MVEEFKRRAVRRELLFPSTMPFPEHGARDDDVLSAIGRRLEENPYKVENDFSISYVGPPHPIAKHAAQLAEGTVFVDWAAEMFPGTYRLEKEAVRMMASLLGKPEAVGFITSGGTESNMLALRLARNLAKKSSPEIVMPATGHYSFRLGAELLGMEIREIPVGSDFKPKMDQVERLITRNTVALVCSAPEGNLGLVDPIAELSDIAQRKGLFLHVDAAFGGFILPFMRDLGHKVPPFDFTLAGVSSIMTDGHKLGLLPVATGFFLIRDHDYLKAIPAEYTGIHTITATKPGERAAAAWAVFNRLGRDGYREYVKNALEVVDIIAKGVEHIDGLRLMARPFITIVNFTSDIYDVRKIHEGLRRRGFGSTFGEIGGVQRIRLSIHPHKDKEHARGFVQALEESVNGLK